MKSFYLSMDETKSCLLMTDYDGTLAPFVSDREKAWPLPEIADTLEKIPCPVILVTGRNPYEIRKLLSIRRSFDVYGEHGSVFLSAGGERHLLVAPDLDTLSTLSEIAETIPEGMVEKKTTSIALHWRGADKNLRNRAKLVASLWKNSLPPDRWSLYPFDGGCEARQNGQDKGKAVASVLKRFHQRPACYLGDDRTDEDAFKALAGNGLSILVADKSRETEAAVRLSSPVEVASFLGNLNKRLESYRR